MQRGWRQRARHTVHTAHAVRVADAAHAADVAQVAHALPAAQAGEPQQARAGDDPSRPGLEPAGCGWFESSRTLLEGTDVREHQVLDPIVNDLPLSWWIEWAGLQVDARRS